MIEAPFGSTNARPIVVTAGRPKRCAVSMTVEAISAKPAIGSRRMSMGKAPAWFAVPESSTM